MPEPQSQLERLVEPVTLHLLPLLADALEACSERHRIADGKGVDNFSFGTDAWSLPTRVFKDAIEEEAIPFGIAPERGCVLSLGQDRVRHHRVGWSEVDAIESSFPGNAHALGKELEHARRQLHLEFPEYEPPAAGAVVLAYMANPGVGLCAAYLTRVGRVEHGKVVGWAETHELYRRDKPTDPAELGTSVPAEKTPRPVVRRAPKRDRDAG